MLATDPSRTQNQSFNRQSADQQIAQALNPASVHIDGRGQRDHLAFVANYASLILYYDKHNRQHGNWRAFFLKEPAILLASISKTDFAIFHQNFLDVERSYANAKTSEQAASIEINCAKQLCELLTTLFSDLNEWFHYMERGQRQYSLFSFLTKKIDTSLRTQLALFINIQAVLAAISEEDIPPPDQQRFNQFEPLWFNQQNDMAGFYADTSTLDPSNDDLALLGKSAFNVDTKNVRALMTQLRGVYFAVFDVFVQVVQNAEIAFQQEINQKTRYPDTGLLMVFVRLLQLQQAQMNQYAQQHLDFYYQQVLQLNQLPAQPDQTIVCLNLAAQVASWNLPVGTSFKAGTYPDNSDILFCNQSEVELNQASIGDVYTLYYGAASQTANLYVNAILEAQQVQRNSAQQIVSWPALGEKQGTIVQQGFAVASPMLLLGAGQRTITLTITCDDQSILPATYFADCQCFLSTASGWLPLALFVAPASSGTPTMATTTLLSAPVFVSAQQNVPTQSSSEAYSLQIQLQNNDPAIVPFAPGNAPDGYISQWPALKIILGDSANLESPPQVAAVEIVVDVTDFDQFVLATDLAQLPPKGSWLMFGAQAQQGNRFYVGSNECFAKPLSKLSLTLNWDNPPADFSNYYASYNQYLSLLAQPTEPPAMIPFTNTAFAGTWSVLNQNGWDTLSVQGSTASQVMLYQVASGSGSNAENAKCSVFLFQMPVSFTPCPALALTPLAPLAQAKNGYCSFELLTPSQGFGQCLYAPLVSYTSFANAQVLMAKPNSGSNDTADGKASASGTTASKNGTAATSNSDTTETLAEGIAALAAKADPELGVAIPVLDQVISKAPGVFSGLLSTSKQWVGKFTAVIVNRLRTAWTTLKNKLTGGSAKENPVTDGLSSTGNAAASDPGAPALVAPQMINGLLLMPNVPYSPKLASLQGSGYSAHARSELNTTQLPQAYPMELYHYGSFVPYLAFDANAPSKPSGFSNLVPQQISAAQSHSALPLFPGVSGQGCLYFSLKNVSAPCTISLYVNISADGQQTWLDAQSVGYYFWSNVAIAPNSYGGWQPLLILENGTDNLNCSGIVRFAVPVVPEVTTPPYWDSPVMPDGDFWIAIASCAPGVQLNISYLNTQAVCLTRTTMSSLPNGTAPKIAADIITGPKSKISQISTVFQPFPSYGGVAAESVESYSGGNSFYHRVSERLNHKDRASNSTDFARMAYAICSELYFVKVLSGDNGAIRLGVVKAYENADDPNAFRPCLSSTDQNEILQHIQSRASAMVGLEILNMRQQVVLVDANLMIDSQINQTTLLSRINEQLKLFLSPWIKSDVVPINISEGVQQSELVNFLLGQQGVIGIVSLSISLSDADSNLLAQKFPICAQLPDTILVSALAHQIRFTLPGSANVTKISPAPLVNKHKISPNPTPIAGPTPVPPPKPKPTPAPSPPPGPKPGATGMVMSPNGLALLTQWEGCRLNMYLDSAGNPSIGIGHCLTSTEQSTHCINIAGIEVNWTHGITTADANHLLTQDLVPVQNAINHDVHVRLNQNQFDALCSFTFNVGTGAFAGSTLLKVLNQGQYDQVPKQLMHWDKDDSGNEVPGLATRRKNEVALWNKPVTT